MSIAIYNPVCGNGTSKSFLEEEVIPLLDRAHKPTPKIIATERPGHAGEVVKEALETTEGEVVVILGSGDGTFHEIINFLSSSELKGRRAGATLSKLYFALVPCGTANALFSSFFPPLTPESSNETTYKLQSVQSFIDAKSAIPLTLAISTLSSSPEKHAHPKAVVSAVVVSTCLHAAILNDSESLRQEIPGIERFKVAAHNNIAKWYSGHAKLLPAAKVGVVEVYDPLMKSFEPYSDGEDDVVDVYGPFAYFLSTVNVDRLEPSFRITPLVKDITPVEATCDLVMIRPLRDPSLSWDSSETRQAFKPKLMKALQEAYNNGNHVNLTYNDKGEIVDRGDGPPVVEYIRCGGWEWVPDDVDGSAHLLCSDGFMSTIEKGGRAVCTAATPKEDAGFMVYA
ncbi:hypothetical protein E1B28_006116 [Marasmius oreades]|uniref:DAGKc domain-containing protein n=1 Tax=Marasmius oreades TaxID=181124 RepID=A0A9P7UUY2_9AGAR|nr:uncharacterized protein E1B28_006116 [Marasmius oreades]KAG7095357.1 hypothetical protein E1B28_006116 [Marasmius oreades]